MNQFSGTALAVWSLVEPGKPRIVGEVRLETGFRRCLLELDKKWQSEGFNLSPQMDLSKKLHAPLADLLAPGALDDAMPDRWGERMIRVISRPTRMSPLDKLWFAGDHRFGALGISSSFERYLPYHESPLLKLESLDEVAELIARVLERDRLSERERQLIASSASMGGAHPKLLISDQGREWIAKFPKGNNVDQLLIEHASMELARRSGLNVAASTVVLSGIDHVLLVERFDRKADGSRVHAVSAKTMLAGEPDDSYAAISSMIRRYSRPNEIKEQQKELFRRMAFNIMIDNTDDHTKNHAFLMDDDGTWELSPAYDIPTQMNGLGFQAIQISPDRKHQNNFSIDHAIAASAHFGMTAEEARNEWNGIAGWTSEWRTVFAECGVTENDLDYLTDFLDAPVMKQHRLNAVAPDLEDNSCRP